MKQVIIALFCSSIGISVVVAQEYEHKIHFDNLSDEVNPIAVIDSIKHENVAGNTMKIVYFSDGVTQSFTVASIDSVTFAEIITSGV